METSGMQPLLDLLNHPYLVRNRLAEQLYGRSTTADHQRLKSRAAGRHRFREEEVKGLVKILLRLADKIDRRAQKLADLPLDEADNRVVYRLLDLPELTPKPLIDDALGPERYFSFYDRARQRGQVPDDWRQAVVAELRRFAGYLRQQCERTRLEARRYPFSYGMGGASHLK